MTKALVTLGIDLGGTKIDTGIVDSSGRILRREVIKTSKKGPETVVNEIRDVIKRLASSEETIIAAGIGMAGQIEGNTGLVHFAPNLGWRDFPLGSELEKVLNYPVCVTNDVRA
ncbi:MAG TPA: ROK family protein, partial [Parachlamydiaceae bacterium]|nr:ROK family protein [Parachlamydiaceae bacterium]